MWFVQLCHDDMICEFRVYLEIQGLVRVLILSLFVQILTVLQDSKMSDPIKIVSNTPPRARNVTLSGSADQQGENLSSSFEAHTKSLQLGTPLSVEKTCQFFSFSFSSVLSVCFYGSFSG